MRRLTGILALALTAAAPAVPGAYEEPPYLQESVDRGNLPPVSERLPQSPLVVNMDNGRSAGRHGGTLNILMARSRDVRQMVVYGYARLVKYNRGYEIVPDILERIEVTGGRIFTLHLRPGHRWSDGEPFTTEDIRYWWEDVANNPSLAPTGPRIVLRAGGELPKVEIIDSVTARFTWQRPNSRFLPALASASPLYIYRPSHYLKRYHAAYADESALNAMAEAQGLRSWAALHNRLDNMYKNDNVELPSLQPWVNTTKPPAERFVFVRNPYFHRVGPQGRQLPYIDKVVMNIASSKIVPAKAGTGESDLQARYLRFGDYTFLKSNEATGGFRTLLWRTGKGSNMALFPNLSVTDPGWRALMRDVRFRRALSLAVDRNEINQVIYFGLAFPAQNTVLPQSPLHRPEYAAAWAEFDPDRANALLDEIGLVERDSEGLRLLPDGRPMEIIVETAGESTEQTDVLALVRDSWRKIGVALHSKPSQREVLRNRIYSGAAQMSIWGGLENGLATPNSAPEELAPTRQAQYQWPEWGQYAETSGKSGAPPDMKEARRLLAQLEKWHDAPSEVARAEIWHEMLSVWSDQVFTIGLVSGVLQPVIVNARLRNLPDKGMYAWNPGAHFGIYELDAVWFDG